MQRFVTPRTVVCQAPPSMGLSRQEYWSGLPFPTPGSFLRPPGDTSFHKVYFPSTPYISVECSMACLTCWDVCSVTRSCPTLRDPGDRSRQAPLPIGFPSQIPGEWLVTSSCRGSSWPRDWTQGLNLPAWAGEFLDSEPPGKPLS